MVLSKDRVKRAFRVVVGFVVVLGSLPVSADRECVAVIYPEVREPYRSVLEEIVRGIGEGSGWPVERLGLSGSSGAQSGIARDDSTCGVVVGLGRRGFEATSAFVGDRPVVAGALVIAPGEKAVVPTVSLVPDARELFERLRHFMPRARSVTVIFDPSQNRGMIEQARREAGAMGLRLNALEARTLREAMVLYRDVLEDLDPESEALWLVQDRTTVDRSNVLPFVLERAWVRRLAVFSSQPAYVKNGVLFSVYPNNVALGRRLGRLARQCALESCTPDRVMALRSLRTAVNLRTADHLGLDIDPRRDPYVDLTFPGSR